MSPLVFDHASTQGGIEGNQRTSQGSSSSDVDSRSHGRHDRDSLDADDVFGDIAPGRMDDRTGYPEPALTERGQVERAFVGSRWEREGMEDGGAAVADDDVGVQPG